MRYQLKLEYLNDEDLRPERQIIPEHEEADMYIRAFVEDINLLSCTEIASEDNMVVQIMLADGFQLEDLHKNLKSMNPKYREMFKNTGLFSIS
jgi:hypothetical protein